MARDKVLIVGDGAREHAIATKIQMSTYEPRIYALMSHVNPGIKRVVEASNGSFIISTTDPQGLRKALEVVKPDIIVVGPEEPQFAGIVNEAIKLGIPAFGVPKELARIEQSKAYARELMWRFRIPGRLAYRAFKNIEDAMEYIRAAGSVAIKPARQSGGKGVRVFHERLAYLKDSVMNAKETQLIDVMDSMTKYDDIEDRIVVEEAVNGVEYTVQVITDGKDIIPIPPIQDHPHVFDGDIGPECGGMGAVSGPGLLPFITKNEYLESVDIVRRTLDALQRDTGMRYVGVLTGQFMLTIYGPTLIEYYSRFGDPEVLNALALLDGDLYEIIMAAVDGRLSSVKYSFRDDLVTISKAIAPLGYPTNRELARGKTIIINEGTIKELGCSAYFGSVEGDNGVYKTLGSRAVELLAVGKSYNEAYRLIENCVSQVLSPDTVLIHRRDIGNEELLSKRVAMADLIRRVYTWRREHGLGRIRIDWMPGGDAVVYDYS